jgi:hypothetical protein
VKVAELMAKLKDCPPEAEVLFDTEAACFTVHLVPVDSAFHEPEVSLALGYELVVLHSKAPREHR